MRPASFFITLFSWVGSSVAFLNYTRKKRSKSSLKLISIRDLDHGQQRTRPSSARFNVIHLNKFEVHSVNSDRQPRSLQLCSQRSILVGPRAKVVRTPTRHERGPILLVVMADWAPLLTSRETSSRKCTQEGVISQTFSLPTSPCCFHSITCAITGRWGPLSNDKAAVISPLACLDTFRSRKEARSGFQPRLWLSKASTFVFIRKTHILIPDTHHKQ